MKKIILTISLLITPHLFCMEVIIANTKITPILPQITQQFYCVYEKVNSVGKKDSSKAAPFTLCNKALHKYYNDESTSKTIIRSLAHYHNVSDEVIAYMLGYKTIFSKIKKIERYVYDENTSSAPIELNDPWYINSTTGLGSSGTFLDLAIVKSQFKKAKQLIEATIDCHSPYNQNYLAAMIERWAGNSEDKNFFKVIKLLLEKKLNPNTISKIQACTLLHFASFTDNKPIARLLLEHNANPYIECDFFNNKTRLDNAFTLEHGEPKGWLKTMYDEINK